MIVVCILNALLVFLLVLLHHLFSQIVLRISCLIAFEHVWLFDISSWQLISNRDPARSSIMRTCEELNLSSAWQHSLNQAVHFVGFATGFSDLIYYCGRSQ